MKKIRVAIEETLQHVREYNVPDDFNVDSGAQIRDLFEQSGDYRELGDAGGKTLSLTAVAEEWDD